MAIGQTIGQVLKYFFGSVLGKGIWKVFTSGTWFRFTFAFIFFIIIITGSIINAWQQDDITVFFIEIGDLIAGTDAKILEYSQYSLDVQGKLFKFYGFMRAFGEVFWMFLILRMLTKIIKFLIYGSVPYFMLYALSFFILGLFQIIYHLLLHQNFHLTYSGLWFFIINFGGMIAPMVPNISEIAMKFRFWV